MHWRGSRLETELTKLLRIEYPIIQGAMAYISESTLAGAVANAGGTGVIGSGGRGADWVRREIRKTKEITAKPFGVNVMLKDPESDSIVAAVCEEKVAFVTLGAGNPAPYFEALKEAGILIFPVVPSVRLARRVEESGADGVIVEGMESGGHIGSISTMALLTNIIPQVGIPVIAAGGIADGRGIAAALLMGAAGVQMGSRFLLTDECQVHPNVKDRILEATDTDTDATGYSTGIVVRGLRNSFTKQFLELERTGASADVLNALAAGRNRLSAIEGDTDNGSVQVGQSLNALTEIECVQMLIRELMDETVASIQQANELLGS